VYPPFRETTSFGAVRCGDGAPMLPSSERLRVDAVMETGCLGPGGRPGRTSHNATTCAAGTEGLPPRATSTLPQRAQRRK
jgi:hypothetical protein